MEFPQDLVLFKPNPLGHYKDRKLLMAKNKKWRAIHKRYTVGEAITRTNAFLNGALNSDCASIVVYYLIQLLTWDITIKELKFSRPIHYYDETWSMPIHISFNRGLAPFQTFRTTICPVCGDYQLTDGEDYPPWTRIMSSKWCLCCFNAPIDFHCVMSIQTDPLTHQEVSFLNFLDGERRSFWS